jgi:hypothetical protein
MALIFREVRSMKTELLRLPVHGVALCVIATALTLFVPDRANANPNDVVGSSGPRVFSAIIRARLTYKEARPWRVRSRKECYSG